MKWILVVEVMIWVLGIASGGGTVEGHVGETIHPLRLAFPRARERSRRDTTQPQTNTETKPETTLNQIAIKIPTNSRPVLFSPRFGALKPCRNPGLFPVPVSCDMFLVCRQEHSSLDTQVYECLDKTVFVNLGESIYDCLPGICVTEQSPDQAPPVVMDPVPVLDTVQGSAGPPGFQPDDKVEILVGEERPNEPDHVGKTIIVGSDATVSGLEGEKKLSINIPIKIIQL